MNIPFKKHLLTSIMLTSLAACGGSDNIDEIIDILPTKLTATFVDSAVAGLDYQCEASSGKTNNAGEFTLLEGETCSFSINGFNIGTTDKITADNLIVTPYDVAGNAENAIKIASILQTIDADGDASNGINITDFDKEIPSNILAHTNEASFITELASVLKLSESDIITFSAAEAHLNTTVIAKKGYHSKAVQDVIDDIIAISPTIESENYAAKLTEYQNTLEAGDDSTNNDIEVLQAVIAIAEVINKASLLTRVEVSMPNNPFDYTEMLPKLLSFATQDQTANVLNFKDTIQGSSDDVAALLYDYALALVNLSDKLGKSFTDENYIAMYSKDGQLAINYQQAQIIRMAALSTANQLSLISAYNIGSDKYLIPQTETLKDVPVLNYHYMTDSTTAATQDIEADFFAIEYDQKSYLADENTFKLRDDEKYLATAKAALTQLTTVAKTIDLAQMDPEATASDNANTTAEINKIYAHMHATDGVKAPLITQLGDTTLTVNLHAFYNVATGLDREDINFDLDNMVVCSEGNYSELLSKAAGKPMCDYTGTTFNSNLYIGDSGEYGVHLQAVYADNNADSQFNENSSIKDILLSCQNMMDDGTSVDCFSE